MGLEFNKKLSNENLDVLKQWKVLFNNAYSNLMVEEDFLKDKSDLAYCHYRVAREYNRINVNKTVSDGLSFIAVSYFQLFLSQAVNDELKSFKMAMFDYTCEELSCKEKKLQKFFDTLLSITVQDKKITYEETITFTKVVKSCFEFTNIYLLSLEE